MGTYFMHGKDKNCKGGVFDGNLGYFSIVLHKSVCCGYSLEAPH